MQEFDVPGMAVAIVKDGRLVVAKGYGVRELGKPGKVDEHTLFGIASNTKAFTATALGMLVDEKKMSWNDPVMKDLPGFAMFDPYVSQQLMVRDALSHRSGLGLGAGDLMFWPDTDRTRAEVVHQTRFIRPASSFRSRYAYNNLMFVVAGEVVREVSGRPYEDFIRERIFAPLQMTETRFGNAGLPADANLASPHSKGWRLDGPLTPVHYTRDDTWAPAAGIRSNVLDLSKWVIAHLNKGALPGGKRLWSEAVENELRTMQIAQRIGEPPPPLKASKANFAGYGLGFGLRDYAGRKVVSHTGGLTGMVTTIAMIPDEHLGVIILTNQEEGGAFTSVLYHVFDHYLGRPPTDWIAAYRQTRTETLEKAWAAEKKAAGRAQGRQHAVAPARAVRRGARGCLVRQGDRDHGRRRARAADDAQPGPRGRPAALAVRHVSRHLPRKDDARRVRHLRPRSAGAHRAGEDGAVLVAGRLQLRLPGPRPPAGAQAGRRPVVAPAARLSGGGTGLRPVPSGPGHRPGPPTLPSVVVPWLIPSPRPPRPTRAAATARRCRRGAAPPRHG